MLLERLVQGWLCVMSYVLSASLFQIEIKRFTDDLSRKGTHSKHCMLLCLVFTGKWQIDPGSRGTVSRVASVKSDVRRKP